MNSSAQRSAESAFQPALRRELRFTETAAVSVGVMAPTLAMSVTGVAAAAVLGRAAPLAFALAALGSGSWPTGLSGWPPSSATPGRCTPLSATRSAARRISGRVGAARHVPGVPAGIDDGRGHLRAGLPEHHGAGARCRLVSASPELL